MDAARILGCLSVLFLGLASWRSLQEHTVGPASRTWFLVGSIFALVALAYWLAHKP